MSNQLDITLQENSTKVSIGFLRQPKNPGSLAVLNIKCCCSSVPLFHLLQGTDCGNCGHDVISGGSGGSSSPDK